VIGRESWLEREAEALVGIRSLLSLENAKTHVLKVRRLVGENNYDELDRVEKDFDNAYPLKRCA